MEADTACHGGLAGQASGAPRTSLQSSVAPSAPTDLTSQPPSPVVDAALPEQEEATEAAHLGLSRAKAKAAVIRVQVRISSSASHRTGCSSLHLRWCSGHKAPGSRVGGFMPFMPYLIVSAEIGRCKYVEARSGEARQGVKAVEGEQMMVDGV